jgi:SPP1 family predicted phage head-tail adaptor
MQAGKLTELITIQAPSLGVDALGQRVESWSTVADVWAYARPLRGREFFAAGQMQSEAAVEFGIRYRDGVAGNMRVLWRGVPHALVADPMDVDGRRKELKLLCSAGIRDGQ